MSTRSLRETSLVGTKPAALGRIVTAVLAIACLAGSAAA
jgi:hypothetical protein